MIMNLGAMLAGFAVIDGFRRAYGDVGGNLAILDFGFVMSLCTLACVWFIREDNWAEADELRAVGDIRRPLAIFFDVWKAARYSASSCSFWYSPWRAAGFHPSVPGRAEILHPCAL